MEATTSRLRSFELSATTFRRLAGLCVFALWLIISTGAVVRLTRSGLGCEHWPGCEPGQPFPEKDYHAYVEFGNRLVGGVTIFLTLALAVGAWFTRGLPRWVRWLAVGVFAGTLAQAPLGAITVYANLHPALVIPHLLLSIAVLGAAIVVGVEAFALGRERGQPLAKELRIAGVGIAAACFAPDRHRQRRSAAGPHSGGEHVYRLWSLRPALLLHGTAVAVLGCSLMFLIGVPVRAPSGDGAVLRRRRRPRGADPRPDGARRPPVPHASSVGARARPCRGRGDRLGLDGRPRRR